MDQAALTEFEKFADTRKCFWRGDLGTKNAPKLPRRLLGPQMLSATIPRFSNRHFLALLFSAAMFGYDGAVGENAEEQAAQAGYARQINKAAIESVTILAPSAAFRLTVVKG